MSLQLGDTAPDFTANHHAGSDRFPPVGRRQLGDSLLPPEGFHAGLHDRARLCREAEAGVRQARCESNRSCRLTAWRLTGAGAMTSRRPRGMRRISRLSRIRIVRVARLYGMIHPKHDELYTVRTVLSWIRRKRSVSRSLTPQTPPDGNFDEILRVIDSLQLTDAHSVSTPVNWKSGDDVIILPSVSDADAKPKFPPGLEGIEILLAPDPRPQQVGHDLDERGGQRCPFSGRRITSRRSSPSPRA